MTTLPVWPRAGIEDALEAIAPPRFRLDIEAARPRLKQAADLQAWVYAAAQRRSLDAVPLQFEGDDAAAMVARAAPCLLQVPGGVLAVRRVRKTTVVLVSESGREVRATLAQVVAALYDGWRQSYQLPDVAALLAQTGLPPERQARARLQFSKHQLARWKVAAGWAVRVSSAAPFAQQLWHAGQAKNAGALVLGAVAVQLTTMLAWYLLGEGALSGRVDPGRLVAWGLAVATAVLLEQVASHWQGLVSIGFTTLLKRRLMLGVLRLDPATLRHEGFGMSMGRVLACENLEALALSGGVTSVLASVELGIALGLLALASWGLFAAFMVLSAAMLTLGALQVRATRRWVAVRLALTHDVVERTLGHRTRSLQEPPELRHLDEDPLLAAYATESRRYDRWVAAVRALVPRSSLVLGLAFIIPIFVAQASPGVVSAALGAVLLTQRALVRLSAGFASLTSSVVAWSRARPVFAAAESPDGAPTVEGVRALGVERAPAEVLVHARNVEFSFAPRKQPVLDGVSLKLRVGEHALLEGASGCGKSTLVSLLSGQREPTGGLLLLGGFDRDTLGRAGWRRHVVAAPQSHENHLLQGSLAFNLLFGGAWPARLADIAAAETLCRELGLGPLLDRMPEKLLQPVGASGWRLSHGERSRVFIARALLQRSELVVLDESFAALDPETLAVTMACVRARARSLLVVAHP